MEKITLGGGCFWCIEAVYLRMEGVQSVIPGYAGGHLENPTYQQVCSKNTGHAEVVQIEFDESKVSLDALLSVFWKAHDPTTKDRQGADVGPQYRSIILYNSENQKQIAEKSKEKAGSQFSEPIVTEIVPLEKFYEAEKYHHNYYAMNPHNPYCGVVILPKLKKLGFSD